MTRTLPMMIILFGILAGAIPHEGAAIAQGDVFSGHGTPTPAAKAPAATDPAACADPQIAQIERETGTIARVFDFRASGTKSGELGGALQDNGLVEHTAMCAGKANALVMFIASKNIAGVDKVTNDYFGASEDQSTGAKPSTSNPIPSPGGGTQHLPGNPGNSRGNSGKPYPAAITRGYPAPPGFRQPQAPNYVCFDEDGYPYTFMVDPGVEGDFMGPEYTGAGNHAVRIPPERVGYDECINPHVPNGCPPSDIRHRYKPIKPGDLCYPPLDERGVPRKPPNPSKGITRPLSPSAHMRAADFSQKAMDACFAAHAPIYRSPDWSTFNANNHPLASGNLMEKSFPAMRFAAEHAMNLNKPNIGAWKDRQLKSNLKLDYLIGWLTHCLDPEGIRGDPREDYTHFIYLSDMAVAVFFPPNIVPYVDESEYWFQRGYFESPLPPFWDLDPLAH